VYTRTLTGQDIVDAFADSGCDSSTVTDIADAPNFLLVDQITLEDGRIEWLESWSWNDEVEGGNIGTFDVFRDRLEIQSRRGRLTVHWTFDGTDLVFSDMEGGLCDDPIAFGLSEPLFTTIPWVRVND
jgi:hypothetical protein